MPTTKAQQRAVEKYKKANYDEIKVRVPKGKKADLQAHVDTIPESLNAFINRAITETMARDQAEADQN